MKKVVHFFYVTVILIVMVACGAPEEETIESNVTTITFSESITNIQFTNDTGESLMFESLDDVEYVIEGLELGTIINLSHDEATLNPNSITVLQPTQSFSVTITFPVEDTDPDLNDSQRTKTVHATNQEEVSEALLDETTHTIVLSNDISNTITITEAVQIDLNQFTINGDLIIDVIEEGTIVVSEGIITGNLEINAPNMTIENNATVNGYINVNEVSSHTYVENGLNNDIRIYANQSTIMIKSKTHHLGVLANNVQITLEAEVETFAAEDSFSDIIVTNAGYINTAILFTDGVTFDDTPMVLSGNHTPHFTLPVIEEIIVETIATFDYGVSLLDIKEALPNKADLVIGNEAITVDIDDYLIDAESFDLITLSSQDLFFEGVYVIPDGVLNGNYLSLTFNVTVRSFRDTFDGIVSVEEPSPIVIEYGLVEMLSEIENDYLPTQVNVSTESGESFLVDVQWMLETGNFDSTLDTAQTMFFVGTLLNVPTGYHDLDEVSTVQEVTVKSNPSVLEDPYGQVHVQSNYPDAVMIDITTQPVEHLTSVTISVTLDSDYNYIGMRLFTSDIIFNDKLTYTQYVSATGSLHIVVMVEPIERIPLNEAFESGDGSEEYPLIIMTTEQLSNMRYFLDKSYYFKLGNDITFDSETYFTPMKSPNQTVPFSGELDGDGYTIYNYKVEQTNDEHPSAFIDINQGVIKNLNFIDAEVNSLYTSNNDGNLVAINYGNINNVTMQGSRTGRGGGLVGRNEGFIEHVSVELDLTNVRGGFVHSNAGGIISDVDVNIYLLINQNMLGSVGGFASSNMATDGNVAVINFITGSIHIDYDTSDNTLNGTDISGFVYNNTGHLNSISQAMIMSSELNIDIIALDATINIINAFVSENRNLGAINHIMLTGELYGRSILSGFVGTNHSGTNPGVISNVTTYVNVHGENSTIAGFVYNNAGYGYASQYKAQIIESKAYGTVTGKISVSNFVYTQNGTLIESEGFGTVIIIED